MLIVFEGWLHTGIVDFRHTDSAVISVDVMTS